MFDPNDSRGARGQTPQAGAGHSGAGDLAIFGAIPAAFVDTPLRAADAPIASPASVAVGPANGNPATAEPATVEPAAAALDTQAIGSGGLLAAPIALAGAIMAPVVFAASAGDGIAVPPQGPVGSSGIATFVPAQQGGGWADQQGSDARVTWADLGTAAPALAAAVAMPPADAIETVLASVAALQTAMTALAGTLPTTASPVASAQAAIDTSLQQAQAVVSAALDDVATLTEGVNANVVAIVSDLAPVASVATLSAPLAASVAALTDSVTAQVATVASLVPDLTAPVESLAASAISSVASITDALGGSDPVGGITTLVGMISAADAFDVAAIPGLPGDLLAPALGALGAADLLAADLLADVAPADALLGIVATTGGGLGALDLDDGLFGL